MADSVMETFSALKLPFHTPQRKEVTHKLLNVLSLISTLLGKYLGFSEALSQS